MAFGGLEPVPPSRFQIMEVLFECRNRIVSSHLPYVLGGSRHGHQAVRRRSEPRFQARARLLPAHEKGTDSTPQGALIALRRELAHCSFPFRRSLFSDEAQATFGAEAKRER